MQDSGKSTLKNDKVAGSIFRAKSRRRKELANLPFKKKIEILIELQKIAHGVNPAHEKSDRMIWKI